MDFFGSLQPKPSDALNKELDNCGNKFDFCEYLEHFIGFKIILKQVNNRTRYYSILTLNIGQAVSMVTVIPSLGYSALKNVNSVSLFRGGKLE